MPQWRSVGIMLGLSVSLFTLVVYGLMNQNVVAFAIGLAGTVIFGGLEHKFPPR